TPLMLSLYEPVILEFSLRTRRYSVGMRCLKVIATFHNAGIITSTSSVSFQLMANMKPSEVRMLVTVQAVSRKPQDTRSPTRVASDVTRDISQPFEVRL